MVPALVLSLFLAASPSEVVADYHQGDMFERWTLTLSADSTFSFTVYGCLGYYGGAGGKWVRDGEVVRLSPTWASSVGDHLSREYYVVPWAQRVYLVPSEDMPRFCSDAHRGGPMNTFFEWDRVPGLLPTGNPLVPLAYRAFLPAATIRAKVVAVSGRRVTVDLGSRAGLRRDMLLFAERNSFFRLRVVSVSEEQAILEGRDQELPEVGTFVVSRFSL